MPEGSPWRRVCLHRPRRRAGSCKRENGERRGVGHSALERPPSAAGGVGRGVPQDPGAAPGAEGAAPGPGAAARGAVAEGPGALRGAGGTRRPRGAAAGRRRRGPSPGEEQHLPPGVEVGRNGPEPRPGSETPRPLPRSGRRAGRKSLTLPPPPPPPRRLPSLAPPPLSALPPAGGGRAPCSSGGVPALDGGVGRGRGGGQEAGLEAGRSRRRMGACVVTSPNGTLIYGRPGAISVFPGWALALALAFGMLPRTDAVWRVMAPDARVPRQRGRSTEILKSKPQSTRGHTGTIKEVGS
ncbi:translation initiation factor IF-2 [Oryctolagus cuniculus]|uniref:translation initiation factor IF-2 n=1 Tax=Oryctolagus cuniculus TaxID=9986 RepID=UPI00222F5FDF|nr:basic proline-rich protein [Oryctolagus cuniculus]